MNSSKQFRSCCNRPASQSIQFCFGLKKSVTSSLPWTHRAVALVLCDADPVQIKAMRASKSAAALILGGSKPELLGASVFGGLCNYKVASSSCGFKIFSNTEPFVVFSTNHFGSLLSRSVLRPISLAAVSPFILQKYVGKKTGVHGDQERGRPITYSCKIHTMNI